jgi:hypothetical protein
MYCDTTGSGDSAEAAHCFQSIGVLQAIHLDDCLAMPQTIAEDLEADIADACDLLGLADTRKNSFI